MEPKLPIPGGEDLPAAAVTAPGKARRARPARPARQEAALSSLPLAKTWFIFRREVAAYFLSPAAYAVMAVYLLICGYFFSVSLIASQAAEMRGALGNMGITFLFMAPILTMRLLAEERRQGTDELLLTSPLSVGAIVAGKYLAVTAVYALILTITGIYPVIISIFGDPDAGPIITGYIGLFLLGASFLAVGVFASSVTDNQMVAGVVGFGILLLLWIFSWAGDALANDLGRALQAVSILNRFDDFRKGILDLANVLFYLSYIFGFLFLAVRMVEKRRWS